MYTHGDGVPADKECRVGRYVGRGVPSCAKRLGVCAGRAADIEQVRRGAGLNLGRDRFGKALADDVHGADEDCQLPFVFEDRRRPLGGAFAHNVGEFGPRASETGSMLCHWKDGRR